MPLSATTWTPPAGAAGTWVTQPDRASVSTSNSTVENTITPVEDQFAGTAGLAITTRSGESGATWTVMPSYSSVPVLDAQGGCYGPLAGTVMAFASGQPQSSNYTAMVRLRYLGPFGAVNQRDGGVAIRSSTTVDTNILAWMQSVQQPGIHVYRTVAGVATELASSLFTPVVGSEYTLALWSNGTQIRAALLGSGVTVSTSDASITLAGRAALRAYNDLVGSATTGLHFDDFRVQESSIATSVTTTVSTTTWTPRSDRTDAWVAL